MISATDSMCLVFFKASLRTVEKSCKYHCSTNKNRTKTKVHKERIDATSLWATHMRLSENGLLFYTFRNQRVSAEMKTWWHEAKNKHRLRNKVARQLQRSRLLYSNQIQTRKRQTTPPPLPQNPSISVFKSRKQCHEPNAIRYSLQPL